MKFLIFGGMGMLGHKLFQEFSKTDEVDVTVRPGSLEAFGGLFGSKPLLFSAHEIDSLDDILDSSSPDVVVNCIGIVKQLDGAKKPLVSIPINSLFPHLLNEKCLKHGIGLIHVSTDCVFSGRLGKPYGEEDTPDPVDLYGRTKLVGEVREPPGITLRTSIIGREIKGATGLIEWFLSQKGKSIKGFSKALYTGFTTIEFAKIIKAALAAELPPGLYQVSSDPISKIDLLNIAKEKFGVDVTIEKDDKFECDRRLDSSRFRRLAMYRPPAWEDMISEMAADKTPYEEWRAK